MKRQIQRTTRKLAINREELRRISAGEAAISQAWCQTMRSCGSGCTGTCGCPGGTGTCTGGFD